MGREGGGQGEDDPCRADQRRDLLAAVAAASLITAHLFIVGLSFAQITLLQ